MDFSKNPLLSLDPVAPLPFSDVLGEHIEPAVHALVESSNRALAALENHPGPFTYDNTLRALELVTEELDLVMGVVSHLESVATTPALRDAYAAVQPAVSELGSRIVLSEGVYRALQSFAATEEAKKLKGAQKRFLDKTLAGFRRHGAELNGAGKKRLMELDVELSTLTLKFSQNVLDATNAFELCLPDASRLGGLPASALAMFQANAEEKGLAGYRVTLTGPAYTAIVTYADDGDLRRTVYGAWNARASEGTFDNREILRRILELRSEKATLLGFASFADLTLEDRMAKRGQAARDLVATLREKARAAALREHEELLSFQRTTLGHDAAMEPSDVAYWAEKLRKARFDFDDEMLRPYVPLDRALSGVFRVVERLYGVSIVPAPELPTWHPSVTAHRLVEADGTPSAVFYVDVFPRETKRDGAWMHGLWTALPGEKGLHIEVLAGNFAPPTGDRPALLTHRELETLLHELGHLMHHAASRVPVRSLGGTAVAWDFVELPSQIMENWGWELEALSLMSGHYVTGEPIPPSIVERMRKARTFRAATMTMRQLGFAELDLALHIDWKGGDAVALARSILSEHSAVPLPESHALLTSFSHLFASPVGYAAGYYSYKWADVLAADAFTRFRHEGLFAKEVGRAFREGLLARGDSEDAGVLVHDFLGRDPTVDALLERDGLAVPKEAA